MPVKSPAELSQIFYRNVRNLCKSNGLRIGDVESEVGLAGGYLSRWRDEGIKLYPAYQISKILHIPLDRLLSENLINEDFEGGYEILIKVKCKNCKHFVKEWCEPKYDFPCPDIERECKHYRTRNNRDVIADMTDVELGSFLEALISEAPWCDTSKYGVVEENGIRKCIRYDCEKCATEWLKQEVEEK